jgi:hypothetical protein
LNIVDAAELIRRDAETLELLQDANSANNGEGEWMVIDRRREGMAPITGSCDR